MQILTGRRIIQIKSRLRPVQIALIAVLHVTPIYIRVYAAEVMVISVEIWVSWEYRLSIRQPEQCILLPRLLTRMTGSLIIIPINNIKDEYNYTTTGFHQYLHAIDIRTGNERPNSPVEITPVVTGTGDGQTSPGLIKFNPRTQFNRAGLVLSNGMVYIAFAAHCDNNPSHGWIVSYDAGSLALVHAYIATPNDGRGGIWMSGTAPAVDESGNIYFTTGNSLNEDRTSLNYNTYNALPTDPANRGEGVIKLAPDLSLSSYFTPFNYIALDDADKDFPTQVMLIPNTQLAMTGCKDNILYIMNKTNLGGYSAVSNNVVQMVSVQSGATMHSSFAYFGGVAPKVYQFSENSPLKSYTGEWQRTWEQL